METTDDSNAINDGEENYSKQTEWIMGIDEAGRGPVLAAMVYGACICPESKLDALKQTGVFDSKQLTDEKRRNLFQMIQSCPYLEWLVDAIPADWMSSNMIQQNRYSLNEISHESAMNLIQMTLDNGYRLKHVYLDTVGDSQAYEKRLINRFMGYDVRFTVSSKADALYPVVSAASICAKVTRDDIMQRWQFIEPHLAIKNYTQTSSSAEKKTEEASWMGIGYPGDEKTKQFMQQQCDKVFGYPSIVRFSWQTAKTIMDERCAPVTFSDQTAVNNLAKWGFSTAGKQTAKRSKFYREQNLKLVFDDPF
eukprot:CAMPEP_0202713320 /NCGR_PEP_ID=MMETSP1385-20130828/52507_1 /ASSEMBLY_ACC=CAM_ASM_000861 /TAXON_ID=933848 /ORGANISM="Elphidium margaritaceum" /LENGTH=307 /DNA_ID=CAMNT_0049373627 /DNA_START=50 /DNA_END=976 /DNA_ORIENTATION=+